MNMLEIGVLLKLTDQMSGGLRGAMGSLDGFGGKMDQLAEKSNRFGRASMANGMILAGLASKPIKAYADLDDAMATLEVSMMQKGGKVGAAFAPLKNQIVELGNKLPGTTADYAQLATTMISLGTPAEKLLGGALDAAANLRVVLKMTSEAAGETVVKLREAYNLTDSDLAKTADIAQRAKFAFGMKPEDLRVAASYQSAQLNILHLSGVENMKNMMVMQGMANLKGLDGSSFGTNMGMMLQRLATGPQMLEMAHRGMKGVGKDMLSNLGIKFEFFDKKGNFAGLEHMIKEFEKFKIIEAKYGEKGVSEVSNALFGIEAARPAMILAQYGAAGFEAAKKRFEEQASLQERINRYLKTAENVWNAFTGTLTNLMAALGGPTVEALKPFIDELNAITGGPLMKWVDENEILVKAGGKLVVGFSALALVVGGTALAVGGLAKASSVISRFFGGGKAGALGGLGNAVSHAAPIPVYVVNQPGMLPGAGSGMPGAIGEEFKNLSKMQKLGFIAARLPAVVEVAVVAWEVGTLISDSMEDKTKDAIGEFLVQFGTFFSKDARDAIGTNMLNKAKAYDKSHTPININTEALPQEISHKPKPIIGRIDIHVDSEGRAQVKNVNTGNSGLKFNAYAGHTMVTP